jgi:hypothetical protein
MRNVHGKTPGNVNVIQRCEWLNHALNTSHVHPPKE